MHKNFLGSLLLSKPFKFLFTLPDTLTLYMYIIRYITPFNVAMLHDAIVNHHRALRHVMPSIWWFLFAPGVARRGLSVGACITWEKLVKNNLSWSTLALFRLAFDSLQQRLLTLFWVITTANGMLARALARNCGPGPFLFYSKSKIHDIYI